MTKFYTCTMNAAIDLWIETKHLHPNTVNRTVKDAAYPNGKGVNVSFVLKLLGIENTALGFVSGFTGRFIEEALQTAGIETDFIYTDGMTRINVFTQITDTKEELKLVNQGPEISLAKQDALLEKIAQIPKDSFLIVSGSLPRGVAPSIFKEIAEICHQNGVSLILDTSNKAVLDVLPESPYLLKPNEEEIAQWFGKTSVTTQEAIQLSQTLIQKGAQHILLSLGGKGAVFINKEVMLQGSAPKIKAVNTACAGDTLLATFVGSLAQNMTPQEALKRAIAAGSSTASQSGLTDFTDVARLMADINIEGIKHDER